MIIVCSGENKESVLKNRKALEDKMKTKYKQIIIFHLTHSDDVEFDKSLNF